MRNCPKCGCTLDLTDIDKGILKLLDNATLSEPKVRKLLKWNKTMRQTTKQVAVNRSVHQLEAMELISPISKEIRQGGWAQTTFKITKNGKEALRLMP